MTVKDIFRPVYYFLKNNYKRIVRSLVDFRLNPDDHKKIPIIINNFNRLTYLKKLISRLEKWGYTNIHVIDNNSTYPPLLEYYSTFKYSLIRLKENKGYMALWQSSVFSKFKYGYYVYTDPDVLPLDSCGEDFLKIMLAELQQFKAIEKLGLALAINDLPDHYNLKREVIALEKKYWTILVKKDIYDSPVDTTFALYKPLAKGNAEQCAAYRINGDLGARHLPWYENSENPSPEDIYYRDHIAKNTTYWSNLNKLNKT